MPEISGLAKYTESACACDQCRDMCHRPCWPTPEEAQVLIDAGYGHLLMNDWWIGDSWLDESADIQLLCPAAPGRESKLAAGWPGETGCSMQKDGLCQLHDLGLKPAEGRFASCAEESMPTLHHEIAQTWNDEAGQELVRQWWKDQGLIGAGN